MNRNTALLNASAAWQYATLFHRGSIISLDDFGYYVQLCVHLPYRDYDIEREKEKYSRIVICGAEFRVSNHPNSQEYVLRIEWPITKDNV